ncbi:MAG: hypothetical protein WCY19_01425 [Candidatus Gastranaerophilaceae bacterium]
MKIQSFTSNVNIDYPSINAHMSNDKTNIEAAANRLRFNNENNDILIKAENPNILKLFITEDNKTKPLSVFDTRKLTALFAKMNREEFYASIYNLTPETQKQIDFEYKNNLAQIDNTPFDIKNAIIKVYEYYKMSLNVIKKV